MNNHVKIKTKKITRIIQGDILKNITIIENVLEVSNTVQISKIEFPLIIVLTQDCDLMQDFMNRHGRPVTKKRKTNDKYLFSCIVAPLYNYEHLILGEHLEDLNQKMAIIDSRTQKNNIKQNEVSRYHFLEFPIETGIAPSVIDFKHYFTIPIEALKRYKETSFVCRVSELYREKISQRFANYLSRIGLPE